MRFNTSLCDAALKASLVKCNNLLWFYKILDLKAAFHCYRLTEQSQTLFQICGRGTVLLDHYLSFTVHIA